MSKALADLMERNLREVFGQVDSASQWLVNQGLAHPNHDDIRRDLRRVDRGLQNHQIA